MQRREEKTYQWSAAPEDEDEVEGGRCYSSFLFLLGVPLVFLLPALFSFTFIGSFVSSDLSPSLYCVLFRSLCLRFRDESKAGNGGFLLFPFLSLCFRSSLPLCYSFFTPSSSLSWFCSPSPVYSILSWSLSLVFSLRLPWFCFCLSPLCLLDFFRSLSVLWFPPLWFLLLFIFSSSVSALLHSVSPVFFFTPGVLSSSLAL